MARIKDQDALGLEVKSGRTSAGAVPDKAH
jgi:hypothetical protein